MASGKSRYNRPPTFAEKIMSGQDEKILDFSSELRAKLREFCPSDGNQDQFTNEILSAAHWAMPQLNELSLSLTKPDCRAEQRDLLAALQKSRDKLRRLSSDLDRLLGAEADPLGCADALDELVERLKEAGRRIDNLPNKQKPNEIRRWIADEMAIRVLRVAQQHGMKISASGSAEFRKYISKAPLLLQAIGDDIGLRLNALTWRNIVAKAKKTPGGL